MELPVCQKNYHSKSGTILLPYPVMVHVYLMFLFFEERSSQECMEWGVASHKGAEPRWEEDRVFSFNFNKFQVVQNHPPHTIHISLLWLGTGSTENKAAVPESDAPFRATNPSFESFCRDSLMRFEMIQLSGLCENCSLGCSLFPALSDCFLDRLAISKRNATDRKRWFHQGRFWSSCRTRMFYFLST